MTNWTQIAWGIFFLSIGTLVYFTDRNPHEIYFIKESGISHPFFQGWPCVFGSMGSSLPSFTHVLAFILITAGVVASTRKGYFIACIVWLGIDWAFELGQLQYQVPVALTPEWFEKIPVFRNTKAFFIYGTFDWNDMLGVLAGAISAYIILLMTQKDKKTSQQRVESCLLPKI